VQTLDEFAFALNDTLSSKRGNVVIPSFAVGRTQEILYYLAELRRQGRIPAADIYVDSPMATAATRITLRHAKMPDLERVRFTESLEESMRINSVRAKVFTINGLSAHADRDALLGWIGQFRRPPGQTWIVHGEPLSAEALKNGIIDGFGWRAGVASAGQIAEL
jgi:Cft2 family RNA processing exonuclease